MITPDSIEAKYQRIQTLIERMDAQSKCRDKPLTNLSGKVVKPATVQCGTVCRQKQNCKVTKGELRKVRSAFKGKSKREMAEAVKALIASKKAGQSSTRATYEATEKPRREKNIKRREKRFERSVEQSEKRAKAKIAPDLPETPAVRLGKPIHDRVTSPEEAIANGRAILGDLIGKMAAEYDKPEPDDYKSRIKKSAAKFNAAANAKYMAEVGLAELEQRLKKEGISGDLKREMEEKQNEVEKAKQALKEAEKENEFLYSVDGVIKHGDIDDMKDRILHYKGRLKTESAQLRKQVKAGYSQGLTSKYVEEVKEKLKKLESALPEKEKQQRVQDSRLVSGQVIQALIDNSSLSQEEAIAAVSKIKIEGKAEPDIKDRMADFVRMTNGQGLETLSKIKIAKGRAHASRSGNMIKYGGYNTKTLFHEMGHHVEYASHNQGGEVGTRFVRGRATGPAKRLSSLDPGKGYDRDEVAVPDHFIDPYVGKVTGPGSSEVISMGLQVLSSPKLLSELAFKDPDHLALVIGMASQRIPTVDFEKEAAAKVDRALSIRRVTSALIREYKPDPTPSKAGKQTYNNGAFSLKPKGIKAIDIDTGEPGGHLRFPVSRRHHAAFGSFLASRPDIISRMASSSKQEKINFFLAFAGLMAVHDGDGTGQMPTAFFNYAESVGWDMGKILKEGDFLGTGATKTDSAPVTYFGLNPAPFYKPFWN